MSELTTISQSQLVRKLKRDRNIDYLAIVTSSWHYLSALSTIKWLKEKRGVVKGIILVAAHPKDGYIINEEILKQSQTDDQEIYDFKFGALAASWEVRSYLLKRREKGKPFYILRPVMPKLEFSVFLYNSDVRKNIVHITIEEGLATYMRDWRGWAFEELKSFDLPGLWNQVSMRTWKKVLCEILLRKNSEFIENTIFVKRKNELIENKRSIYYLKKTLNQLARKCDLTGYEYYSDSIIVCTQPYGEQNGILQNADLKAIEGLCEIANEMECRVVIKPHPREKDINKYEKIGCIVDQKGDIPLELILGGVFPKPRCVVGITTTTLITGKLFWNIPSISLARLVGRENYAKEVLPEIDNFCSTFSNMVQIPDEYRKISM